MYVRIYGFNVDITKTCFADCKMPQFVIMRILNKIVIMIFEKKSPTFKYLIIWNSKLTQPFETHLYPNSKVHFFFAGSRKIKLRRKKYIYIIIIICTTFIYPEKSSNLTNYCYLFIFSFRPP